MREKEQFKEMREAIKMAAKEAVKKRHKNPGRPVGTYQYDEKKISVAYKFTPTAHAWIKANKDTIEKLARK